MIAKLNYYFFDSVVNKNALIFFRIGIAFIAFTNYIILYDDHLYFFDINDPLKNDLNELINNNGSVNFLPILYDWWNHYFHPHSFANAITIVYSISLLFLLLGLCQRIAATIACLIHIGLLNLNFSHSYGIDFFISISLFYCICFTSQNIIDLIRKKRYVPKLDTLFIRILKFHLSIIYFFSGLGKIMGINWWNGESVWKSIHLPYFNLDFHLTLDSWASNQWIFIFAGISVCFLELSYPFLIFNEKTKKVIIFSIIMMHLSIAIFLSLYFFAAMMIVWNLTVYVAEKPQRVSKGSILKLLNSKIANT